MAAEKPEWMPTGEPIVMEGILAQYHVTGPDEVEHPPFTHHLLTLLLNDEPHQMSCFDGRVHEGPRSKGDFFILPKGYASSFRWHSNDKSIAFIIDSHFLQNVVNENEWRGAQQVELIPKIIGNDPLLSSLGFLFKQEMFHQGPGSQLYKDSLVNLLAIHLLRHYCVLQNFSHGGSTSNAVSRGLSSSQLKQTIDFICAHLDQKLTLKQISKELNLSQYYFCELFRKSMGMPPYQYVLQQRIQLAKHLLKQKDKALADIARECGFANQTHMTRYFRRLTGVTPSVFRRRLS